MTARAGHALPEILRLVDEEIARLAQEPPAERELTRFLNRTEAGFYDRLERVGGFGGKADQLNAYYFATGNPDFYEEDLARYRALSPSDVQAAASRWLGPRTGARLGRARGEEGPRGGGGDPMNARRLAFPALAAVLAASPLLAQPDRSAPPKPGPVKPLKLPAVERLALSNGVGVLLVPMHEVPVVEVLLVVRAGATADPAGREGLARTTADMLDEGAGGRDALALADAIDFLGAQLGTEASWDASTVRLRVPVARLADALPVMADVALRPDFPESELLRLRKEALTDLLQARDVPGRIASRALAQAVFGTAHRYGRPEGGDAASISRPHRRRPAGVPRLALRPGGGDPRRRRRRDARRPAAAREGVRRVARRGRPGAGAVAWPRPPLSRPGPCGWSTSRAPRSRRSASAPSARPGAPPATPRPRS